MPLLVAGDNVMYQVLELCTAFKREYKAGTELTLGDIASWDVSPEDESKQIARMQARGQIEKIDHSVAVPEPHAEPEPEAPPQAEQNA
jgi:hypothetical protein